MAVKQDTEQTRISDEREIRALIHNMTNSLRKKNADGVVSAFAENSVMFVLAPPLQFVTGKNSPGRNGVEEWLSTWKGEIGYETRDSHISIGDDVAFCHGLNRLSGSKKDGESVDMWMRETLGLCKIDGEWKITHQHQSVPFYMDSGKAALDLKP